MDAGTLFSAPETPCAPRRVWRHLFLVALGLVWSLASLAGGTVRIGVLSFQDMQTTLDQWTPTARYLGQQIPDHPFEVIALSYDDLNSAVEQKRIEFVLTNPEHYVVLRNVFGLSPMVTQNTRVGDKVMNQFGSVVFTRTASTIQTLADVRGHSVAAVGKFSLGGYLMAADQFRSVHIDLSSRDVRLTFTGVPHNRVVKEVMEGRSEVGIVRTGLLEMMARRGELDLSALRVLNPKTSAAFPQALSTSLMPEWPWAASAQTDPALIKAVTLALLNMQPDSDAARAAGIHDFSPPANYAPVEDLMRRLKVYPRVETKPLIEEIWAEYHELIQWSAFAMLVAGLTLSAVLARSNRRLRAMTQLYSKAQAGLQVTAAAFSSQVGLIVTDEHTIIARANAAFMDILGYPESELVGQSTAMLRGTSMTAHTLRDAWAEVETHGHWQGELMCRHHNGSELPCMVTITVVRTDMEGVSGFVGSFVDLSQQKRTEAEIRNLAHFDPLTELPNRRLFLDRLEDAMAESLRTGSLGALLFIDLDHFKSLNDTHGHSVGDQLLCIIGQRLQAIVGHQGMVARLGGDEFVVMLHQLSDDADTATREAMAVGQSVRQAILEPYLLVARDELTGATRTLRYACSGSIGVSLFGQHCESEAESLKRADVAMYQAKQAGRNAVRAFDPTVQDNLVKKIALTTELNAALIDGQLQLHYQLQCDGSGRAVGAECLLRWQHPTRGMVSPMAFIPLAEESGAIIAIGDHVVRTACQTLSRWATLPSCRHLTLSVNVSPRQFTEPTFVPHLIAALQDSGARPQQLILEITEGIVLQNTEQVTEKMQALCALGLSFSIDDFGTGYSSLSYLQRLPLREVKIDKAFVQNLGSDKHSDAIVRTIVLLGDTLGLNVVSEGVETELQRAQLLAMGCSTLQGYLLGRPLTLDAFEEAIAPTPPAAMAP